MIIITFLDVFEALVIRGVCIRYQDLIILYLAFKTVNFTYILNDDFILCPHRQQIKPHISN